MEELPTTEGGRDKNHLFGRMIVTSSFKRKGRGFVDNGKTNSEVLEDYDLETNNYRIKTLTNKKIPDSGPTSGLQNPEKDRLY